MIPNDRELTFKPITKSPAVFNLGAFDIEGVGGPNGFVLGGVKTSDTYETFTHPSPMIDYMRQRKFKSYRFFAHNLTYDYGILEPYLTKLDYPLLINGRVFKVRIANGKGAPRFLADSLFFSGGISLKNLGSVMKYPKLDTPENLILYDPRINYHHRNSIATDPVVHQYLERDNEIVLNYMQFFQSTINELGGEVKFTLASTAMDLFRRRFLDTEYLTPFHSRNEFARNAYYGGRVEPFRLGTWEGVNGYDINSLYPYVMYTYEYPHPDYLKGPLDTTDPSLIDKYEGISYVKIFVPDNIIPPLPYRHNGKLYFPTGLLSGYYTHADIRHALEQGCILRDIQRTLYSTQTCTPFKSYVSELYKLRQELKAINDPRQHVIKIMLNSLYGKFGQRTNAGLQELHPITWWLDGNQHISVSWREIGDQIFVVVPKLTSFQPQYVNVLWAAYITSYARNTLYGYMAMCEDELIYSDTDSVYIRGELTTGKELGQMKLEKSNIDLEVYGPKAYRIFKDGELIDVKCKGVPSDNRDEFLTTGQTTFSRPTGLLEAGKLLPREDGTPYYPSEWRDVTKRTHFVSPKRLIVPLPGFHSQKYLTFPHSVDFLPD